jgi:cysteinyl-tRNA synthetase
MISGVRIAVNENKRHPGDFVLWKPSSPKDDASSVFPSPWGDGRPGWHIECSAMSNHFLGTDFDIHGGGADLIFPHHTNEIAQSCCAFPGSAFAKYWVHNGFLTVNGEKMSKSLGNFLTVYDLIQKDISGDVIRYLLLSTHYRKPLDFNEKAIYDAKESVGYIKRALESCEYDESSSNIPDEFLQYLFDDLNTPGAFSIMHELAKTIFKTSGKERLKAASELHLATQFIGLFDCTKENSLANLSEEKIAMIEELVSERQRAKTEKNWSKADKIRKDLSLIGITLEDRTDGTTKWTVANFK